MTLYRTELIQILVKILIRKFIEFIKFLFLLDVDSFPKPPSGTLLGNILWNGDYHECNSIPSLIYDPKTKLTTKYCRLGKPNDNPLVPVPVKIMFYYLLC